jgi:transcriptional regulator with XRE-family HTH domain
MLNKRLKVQRIAAGLTQQQVADGIGIARVNYTQYELGRREPDYGMLVKFAEFFGCSTDYLLGYEPPAPGVLDAASANTNPLTGEKMTTHEKLQLHSIVEGARALFFDTKISPRDKETLKKSIEEAFWQAKAMNKRKKKNGPSSDD